MAAPWPIPCPRCGGPWPKAKHYRCPTCGVTRYEADPKMGVRYHNAALRMLVEARRPEYWKVRRAVILGGVHSKDAWRFAAGILRDRYRDEYDGYVEANRKEATWNGESPKSKAPRSDGKTTAS